MVGFGRRFFITSETAAWISAKVVAGPCWLAIPTAIPVVPFKQQAGEQGRQGDGFL